MSNAHLRCLRVAKMWLNRIGVEKAALSEVEHPGYMEVRVVPTNPDSCPVSVFTSDVGSQIVHVGEDLSFSDDDNYIFSDDALSEVLGWVSDGEVRELLWYRGSRLVRSEGHVGTGPRALSRSRWTLGGIFGFRTTQVVRDYVPY